MYQYSLSLILKLFLSEFSHLSRLSYPLAFLTNSFQLRRHRRTRLVLSSLATMTITNIEASANSNTEPMPLNLRGLPYATYLTYAHYPSLCLHRLPKAKPMLPT